MTRSSARAASCVALLVAIAFHPLHAQSALDGFNPGADGLVFTIVAQPDGKILVGGGFEKLGGGGTGTTTRRSIGRLNPDGSLDLDFNPGADGPVMVIAVQPDGKILVGGGFGALGGGTGTTARSNLGRLNPDGSLDMTFDPGANSTVDALVVQPDGKILVGGQFWMLGGGGTGTTARNYLGRLNPDGSLDTTFNPGADFPGADFRVAAVALHSDGKILVGGVVMTPPNGGGTPRRSIGRLNPDGSLDVDFNPGADSSVNSIAVQSDGKILLGGTFTALGSGTGTTPRSNLGRLNSDGSLDTTFDPGANKIVTALAVEPDGNILVGGLFTTLGGGGTGATPRRYIGRLHPDGSLDVNFNPELSDAPVPPPSRPCCPPTQILGGVYAFNVQLNGKILVGGAFSALGGQPRWFIGGLYADGSLDGDFNPDANVPIYQPSPGVGAVSAVAMHPNGQILVGGSFTRLNSSTDRNAIGRLYADGSLDVTFDPGANGPVGTLAVQPDGKILVAGSFTTLGGGGTGTTPRSRIGRLLLDGSLDTAFDPGANDTVSVVAVQPDGKILVAGSFTTLGGGGTGTTPRSRIARLLPDGSLDTSFDPGASGPVRTLAVQPDGKILVGGEFTTLGGGGTGTTLRNYIGRLNPDGTVDTTFSPGANGSVTAMTVQSDGQILVGGGFGTLGGGGTGATARNHIGRIHSDGSLDITFDPGANNLVLALAVQVDGRILVGGNFGTLGGGGTGTTTRNSIGRLHPDGVLDTAFNSGANGIVDALVLQPDGKVLVGGWFTQLLAGTVLVSRHNIGRITTTVTATQRLSVACPGCEPSLPGAVQTNVTWARSGAGPEIERVTFDVSPDGATYASAGSATRVAGGWQLTGVTLPANENHFVRARGYYSTGSGSIIESIRQVYIACPTAIAPTSLPAASTGLVYIATLTAPGALGVVTYGVRGALPAGLTLSSGGTLSGTPAQAGTFRLTVTATDQSGCTVSQPVTLPISSTAPLLTLDKTSLRFAAVTTGTTFVSQTAAQVVRLTQSGAVTVNWTAVPSDPWLQVSPASGSGSAELSISVVPVGGLPIGSPVAGAITLTVTGGSNPPGPIAVSLDLLLNELSATPFGVVETPLEHTTGVTGSIPFTGWALDDVEVTRVMVCRAAVTGEVAPVDPNCGGAAQIFVGFAVFIDGARPDVAAAYPTYPLQTRAGWGFMVLTNTLPSQGNGTYLFSIYAQDREGHTTLLGTRAMTCANASATKPFGTLDTPAQGGVASGSNYLVYGWVLSRAARADPPGGGTVSVQVNGVTIGSPGGWAARTDLSAVFPGYPGIDTSLGVYTLSTLQYPNGLHTIQWTVTDHLGVTEGIGSRFFTVSNGPGAGAAVEGAASSRVSATADMVPAIPRDDVPVLGRRGWDPGRPWRWYGVSHAGRTVMRGEEIDRFELWLGAQGAEHFTGHLRVGDGLAALPAGSQLDEATGWFTWAPGVGFVGTYDLVFVRWAGARAVARQEVRVILAPKGSGAVGPQVVIDAPRSSQDVVQPFALGGWAADLNATAGTGIATLHAWAYPLAGGPPVFLGAASYGGARPDVAAVHGDQFRDSGYGLVVQGLAHGHYDLAVFAWSAEAADFVPATVVRVTVR